MGSQYDCEVCARLWRQYGEATRKHVTLLRRQEELKSVDPQAAKELEDQINRAGMRREAARVEIRKHQAIKHDQKTMTA